MMNYSIAARQTLSVDFLSRALVGAFLLLFLSGNAAAQNSTQGATPMGLAPGAPAGSYALSDFENVNLYNGNLNFSLPLVNTGGRGGGGHAITLNLDHKWSVKREHEPPQPAKYIPTANWLPDPTGLGEYVSPYGVGKLTIRQGGSKNSFYPSACGGGTAYYQKTLTRLTFTAPGGTEYELRDTATDGEPQTPPCGAGFNRGKIFVTADGSAATFISDTDIVDAWSFSGANNFPPSGYMLLKDGTRYRIVNGEIRWSRDRNGNQTTFEYNDAERRITNVTDSLNRQVTITYATSTIPYDEITFKGFEGATRTVRINYTSLGNALRSDFGIQSCEDLFQGLDCTPNVPDNGRVISSVTLPDGREYQFFYNPYSELARVVLPTGAAIEYDYAAGLTDGAASGLITFSTSEKHIYRRVTERRVYPDGGTGSSFESKTTYSRPETTTTNAGYVIEVNMGPGSEPLGRQIHYFHGSPRLSFPRSATEYPGWQEGREYLTQILEPTGTTVLREIAHTFAQRPHDTNLPGVAWWLGAASEAPPNNVRLVETVTTLADSSQVTKQTYSYDQFNNLTDTYEYDYGNVFVRRTHTDYLTAHPSSQVNYASGAAFNSVHIRNLPKEQWVSSDTAGNNKVSRTTYEYDNYDNNNGTDPNHAALIDRTDISGLCANFTSAGVCSNTSPGPTAYQTRGNVTAVTRWLLSSSTAISTYAQYDIAGNVVKAIDALGNETIISYTDNFGEADGDTQTSSQPTELSSLNSYAFPTSIANELGHTIYSQYDFYLGAVVDGKDINGVISSSFYEDDLDRPTQVIMANNITALRQQKTFSYDDDDGDGILSVMVTGDLRSFNDNLLKSQTLYDGLGRTTETRAFENATDYIATQQVPFAMQLDAQTQTWRVVSKVSNPFRPQQGEQPMWTTTVTDTLGRVISMKTSDNATVSTTYSGNAVTVTDQAGKVRRSISDALGRLIRLDEPNSGNNLGSVASPVQPTSYTYDVLNNLRKVAQGSQSRYFLYDSFSQLIRARNPEQDVNTNLNLSSDALTDNNSQWSVAYSYDNNGNLLTMTDARGTITTYAYDSLNRVTQRSYGNGTAAATPTVTYTYDAAGVAYSKGRLTSVSSSVSTYNYTGYDALGRVTGSQQITDGQTYSMGYTYDLAGNMTSQTYPTGRVVTNNFDNTGRLSSINGQASGGTQKTYANSFAYTAHGAVERVRFGNGRWEHTNYDPHRLQPIEIGLGTSSIDSSLLKLEYNYGTTDNNGNVKRQIITVPTIGTATGFTSTQHYQYDELNRLTGAQEVGGISSAWQTSGQPLWQQCFTYDRFGNRSVDTANTDSTLIGPDPQISTSTNRIVPRTTPSVEYYEYDPAGNLTKGQGGDTFTYDGENELVQYEGGSTQIGGANYFYDGDGRRVKKAKPSETLIFVYNISGQLVAEYTSSTPENNGTNYLTSDTLGTPRIITKADSNVKYRHDYLPFGEELYAATSNRTTSQGYNNSLNPADKTRQKFTTYERDIETDLDYAQARYYSAIQGRYTSVDPFNIVLEVQAEAKLNPQKAQAELRSYLSQPQQWNRYSYAINNPLLYVDPTGEAIQLSNDKDERERQMQALREAVGPEAATYLYVNQGTNADGSANYYVGIYNNGPDGNGPAFEQINEVAGEYGSIISDDDVVKLEFVGQGNVTDDAGDTKYIGRGSSTGFMTPAVTGYFKGQLTIKMLDWSKNDLGYLPAATMSNNQDNMLTRSVMLGHELGHARARMTGYSDKRGNVASNDASLRLENKIRKLQFPNGPTRRRH